MFSSYYSVPLQGQLGYLDLKRLFESAIKIDDTWDKGFFEYAR